MTHESYRWWISAESWVTSLMHKSCYMTHESYRWWISAESWVASLMNSSCDMTHSSATWLAHMTHEVVRNSLFCDMARSYDSWKWLIDMWHEIARSLLSCDMTRSYVTWLIHMWHASFMCAMPHSYVTCHMHTWRASFVCDMPHSYVTRHLRSKKIRRNRASSKATTGWRRLIGSPKVQIIFHKRATKYRSLLRKMTYQDEGSHECSPPCRLSLME